MEWVFDVRDDDVFWCAMDLGWIAGHTYGVYGPLTAGVATLMYEGALELARRRRVWDIIQRHRATIFYTASDRHPLVHQVGRSLARADATFPACGSWARWAKGSTRRRGCGVIARSAASDARSSTPGGRRRRAAIMISPLPGATAAKPGSCAKPLPGVVPEIVGEDRKPVDPGKGGWLVIAKPWPGMIRGIWGDEEAVQAAILEPGPRQIPLRRQRAAGRRRRLLDHGPHRRRA